jgi:hypothetical protein
LTPLSICTLTMSASQLRQAYSQVTLNLLPSSFYLWTMYNIIAYVSICSLFGEKPNWSLQALHRGQTSAYKLSSIRHVSSCKRPLVRNPRRNQPIPHDAVSFNTRWGATPTRKRVLATTKGGRLLQTFYSPIFGYPEADYRPALQC